MNFLTPFRGCGAALAALLAAAPGHAQRGTPPAGAEWRSYAGMPGSAKYSPLAQIDSTNFKKLHIA